MKYTKRQKEIIIAATELIGESGVQNLTTKSLAKKIGFSEPALYRHFKNKNDILRSILLYYNETMGEDLKLIIFGDFNGMEKLTKIIEYQFRFFNNFPAVIMVIFSETSFQNNENLSQTVKSILDKKRVMVGQIIKSGQKDGSIRNDVEYSQLTNVLMGSMRVTILNWRLSKFEFSLLEESQKLISTLKRILKN